MNDGGRARERRTTLSEALVIWGAAGRMDGWICVTAQSATQTHLLALLFYRKKEQDNKNTKRLWTLVSSVFAPLRKLLMSKIFQREWMFLPEWLIWKITSRRLSDLTNFQDRIVSQNSGKSNILKDKNLRWCLNLFYTHFFQILLILVVFGWHGAAQFSFIFILGRQHLIN